MTIPQSDPQTAGVARTPAQRGPFGRWLTRVRTERYERQVDALEAMKRLAGLHISQAEYSQWESGSRVPRDDNPKVARLYEFFGSRPESETGPAAMGEAEEIAEAIRAQTRAIEALAETIREGQDRQAGSFDGLADGLLLLLARLTNEHAERAAEAEQRLAGKL